MIKKHKSAYLAVYIEIKGINKRYKLDKLVEISLMNYLYGEYLAKKCVRVLDVLLLEDLASQATLHASLKTLRKKGLIELKNDPKDGRSKFIFPTKLSLKRFQECEAVITRHGKK